MKIFSIINLVLQVLNKPELGVVNNLYEFHYGLKKLIKDGHTPLSYTCALGENLTSDFDIHCELIENADGKSLLFADLQFANEIALSTEQVFTDATFSIVPKKMGMQMLTMLALQFGKVGKFFNCLFNIILICLFKNLII